ncbi:hypothetical protein [Enterococcus faecalis]|uniref:hypothetical protein n=1 Tax=Enterococcus faecalis TaxID=1351 RepID=UPI001E4DBC2D|nr:hypothetical protein [Enterococcus faecalis]MCE2549436.1 hypothetical protein [Enterococcus faecalis]
MSELTKLQKISALSKDLMNKKMNDTDRFVHLSHIHELAEDLQPELNKNQQIVLDWLKERFNETEIKASCTGYLWKLHQSYIDDEADEAGIAYEELSYEEESEVVRVFAEWVIEQGEEK